MYTRRYYRKPPPGYSGVAFHQKREEGVLHAENGTLSEGAQSAHREECRISRYEGQAYEGRRLTPLLGGEEGGVTLEGCKTAEKASASAINEAVRKDDELILLGALLFLLGSGIDEEALLVLLCMLILLT